jgi:hypothetical protein
VVGEIVRKGTNYLSIADVNGKVYKAWLHEINEGVKDLPPHLQKLVKQLDKKEKELEKKGLKVKTFIYNPDTGKPDIELDEGLIDKIASMKDFAKNKILKIKKALSTETAETKKMLAIYKNRKNASRNELKFANDQFKDILRGLGLATFTVIPIPGAGLLLPALTTVAKKKFNINILPSAFYEEFELDERNYRNEYDNYHARPEQREKNAARLRARRLMVKNGKVKPFDDMDVHHKDNNPLNNEEENLEVTTKKWNRTEPRLRTEKTKGKDDFALIDADNRIVEKGTEEELKKKAQDSVYARLRVVPAYKQKVGDRVRNVGESVELGEEWWDTVLAKISQMTHPKNYGDMVKDYAELMKQKKYKDHPSIAASMVAREYDINIREFIKYINKLIAKKILPKELTAEYEVSFKSLVQQIQERELTDTEQKRREEIAKNMSDENFKKKYGDRWKEVKMAVATNMAKKEIE